MNRFRQAVELAANIAIIAVAGLLCVILVKNHLMSIPTPTASTYQQSPARKSLVGEKISLPEITWQKNGQTLLLVLSTTCRYCTESTPFYQRLINERSGRTRIVAVLPQSLSESKEYLGRHGLSVDDIEQVDPNSIKVGSTPTLIWVNGDGVVSDMWVGKLPKAIETEVLERVQQSIARN